MNRNWPPPQAIRVGFDPNQQGHAALQEQASSSWPTIFQAAFLGSVFCASAAREIHAAPAPMRRAARTFVLVLMLNLHGEGSATRRPEHSWDLVARSLAKAARRVKARARAAPPGPRA